MVTLSIILLMRKSNPENVKGFLFCFVVVVLFPEGEKDACLSGETVL